MQIQSHLLVSKVLYQQMSKRDIVLDRQKFSYGNIQPDLCGLFLHHSHRIDAALDYVVSLMNKLILLDMKNDTATFSRDLGIVCHYLTDFFTFPHNNHYEGGLGAHLSLERKMHQQIKEFVRVQLPAMNNATLFPEPDHLYSLSDLLDYLMALHERYMEQTTSDSLRDFSFALFACSTACKSIVLFNQQREHFLLTMHTVSML